MVKLNVKDAHDQLIKLCKKISKVSQIAELISEELSMLFKTAYDIDADLSTAKKRKKLLKFLKKEFPIYKKPSPLLPINTR